jgi:hypothetical protein
MVAEVASHREELEELCRRLCAVRWNVDCTVRTANIAAGAVTEPLSARYDFLRIITYGRM